MNIQYIRVGDYYIPDLTLPEETRPIGKWGRMHRGYLREHKPIQYNCLLLSGKLWTYLADLNEQAQDKLERMIDQMKAAEGITEPLKASDPMAWVANITESSVLSQFSVFCCGCVCTGITTVVRFQRNAAARRYTRFPPVPPHRRRHPSTPFLPPVRRDAPADSHFRPAVPPAPGIARQSRVLHRESAGFFPISWQDRE